MKHYYDPVCHTQWPAHVKIGLKIKSILLLVLMASVEAFPSAYHPAILNDSFAFGKEGNTAGRTAANLLANMRMKGAFNAIVVVGKVADAKEAPLPGVSIMVKGTANGATTDVDGRYSVPVADEKAVLVFDSTNRLFGGSSHKIAKRGLAFWRPKRIPFL